MVNFRQLKMWQSGMDIVVSIYKLSEILPSNEKYGLRSQITRAAISIPSNIAEGSSRDSQKDFKRFLEMALGSAFELETQLICVKNLELLEDNHLSQILKMLEKEQKMINSYIKKIKSNTQHLTPNTF